LRARLKESELNNEVLSAQVAELSREKIAWTRVESALKDRIHKLQEDYYQIKL